MERFSPTVRVAIGAALAVGGALLVLAVACGGAGTNRTACGRVGATAKGHTSSSAKWATAGGSADRSSGTDGFGTGGEVFTAVKSPVAGAAAVAALAIQSDGRIVVTTGSFDLIRYTRKGGLDRSFGRGGKVQGHRRAWVGRDGANPRDTVALAAGQ